MNSWVFALPVDQEIWAWDESKKDYTKRIISSKQAKAIVLETRRALDYWKSITPTGSTPYRPPVLREHERTGTRFGSVLDAKVKGFGKKRGIYLHVDWLSATYADIEEFKSQHVSIGISGSYRDGTGEQFSAFVDELSLTEHPRLRGIGSIQDTLSLRLSDAIQSKEKIMSEDEIMALVEQFQAQVAELAAQIQSLTEQFAAMKPVEIEASDSDKDDEDDLEASDEDKEKKEDEMAARLADKIHKNLLSLRLGDRPTPPAPSGVRKPVTTEDKLAAAKASGLTGRAAIEKALK